MQCLSVSASFSARLKLTHIPGRAGVELYPTLEAKLLAVPIDKLSPLYRDVKSPQDFAPLVLDQIQHFFAHYKDLEPGKWVKIEGWKDADAAKQEIVLSVQRYAKADPKPAY